jgi:CRISPR-associated protein Csb2
MTYALLISVRFHDGRYHGAGNWPPSPARLFQALVAATAEPVLSGANRDALEWLERQVAPTIAAPAAHLGQHVSLFVPNNDLDAKGGDVRRVGEIRKATKHIRPRLFDAAVPLLYVWRIDAQGTQSADCVCRIAEGLYQLGRGVDMAWAVGEVLDESDAKARLAEYPGAIYRPSSGGGGVKLACPEEDSLTSLEARYKASATRFRHIVNGKKVRTEFSNAPRPRFRSVAYNSPPVSCLFDLRRTTGSGSSFAPWRLTKAAGLVEKLRGADGNDELPESGAFARLAKHFDRGLLSRIVIGRDAGEADKARRPRIVPLPSIGHMHVDRGIRRVLVEVPPDCPISANDIAWAFAGLEVVAPELDGETGEIMGSPVELVPSDDDAMLMHYGIGEAAAPSRLWRSVTPLALSTAARRRIDPARQHEQAKSGAEYSSEQKQACHEIAQALRHAGLRDRITHVHVQREPFEARGERAEAFADGTRFSKHQLWHAEIEFAEPVHGPIVLGSGRYLGLGLMAPVRKAEGVFAFAIVDGMAASAEPLAVARALRRAVMARVQAVLDSSANLALFFTGHEPDGKPARSGGHAHLAFVPDLERKRLLIIAPHIIEHREASKDERHHLETLAQALAGFDVLRAGPNGKLRLAQEHVDMNTDPLFAAATTWVTRSPYVATRHAKRNGADSLQSDVTAEVRRRGLPAPLVVERRPAAGEGLSLRFAVAVSGPLLLGKNMHYGGGLFAARPHLVETDDQAGPTS